MAWGAALNEALASTRISRDIDLFHDTDAALDASWTRDRTVLLEHQYTVRVLRDRPGVVEAEILRADNSVIIEWTGDSAFRFFPLVEHDDFGLVPHPFDLAKNKVLALAGRLEPRDWVDVILSSERLQPLGYLTWAACGKDPASARRQFSSTRRASRYSADELQNLAFASAPPDPADVSRRWHQALEAAQPIVRTLPAAEVGTCVLTDGDDLFRGSVDQLEAALAAGTLRFHRGRIGGSYPRVVTRRLF